MKKKLIIGILAHVDAGKTTLSEALLYLSGKLRALGRVDHQNTYLDTYAVERERGITIFSKQARFSTRDCDFILLDTPGHVDFSAETERTLALLDYAILVISAPDGVQNHTRTLWHLLEHYAVPTFIFVNKTDIAMKRGEDMAAALAKQLSPLCVPFFEKQTKAELDERLAMVWDTWMEDVLSGDTVDDGEICSLIAQRRLFPCFFGSALKLVGIDFFLDAIDHYTLAPLYDSETFGGRVYKIQHASGTRLTYLKVTGGKLTARDELTYAREDGQRITEKVSQLRLYSGEKFQQVDSVDPGEICAVIGLSATYVGQGLGAESDTCRPLLEPVLSYELILPEGYDPGLYYPKLKELEEEEPSLHLGWNEELRQLEVRLMGDIQIDLLKRLIHDRLGMDCLLDTGRILYKEKVAKRAVGVGHFEPLRHYAEVQLLLEPAPKGTGLIFDTHLPENTLDLNWQRLILSHLYEKAHRGTLTGALLTDTKITLVAGRAHLKHTEGGDFREATLRAVRHGLMKAGCELLEPYYKIRLEIPHTCVGRAMSDLTARHAEFEVETSDEETTLLVGRAPVATMLDYAREVIAYTRGQGRLFCVSDGYEICHNPQEVIDSVGYDPEADLDNTPHSVFCAHGAGFVVHWREVDNYRHLDATAALITPEESMIPRVSNLGKRYHLSDEELESIMLRATGPIKRPKYSEPRVIAGKTKPRSPGRAALKPHRHMVIIDGYNLIHSWESLTEIASHSLEKARETLMDILSSYVAYTGVDVTLVFDAYLVKDNFGSDTRYNGYRVVYTREDQTADAYIEKMMHDLGPDYTVKVVTGDRLLQFSAVHSGISRRTAKEFEEEVTAVGNEITDFIRKLSHKKGL